MPGTSESIVKAVLWIALIVFTIWLVAVLVFQAGGYVFYPFLIAALILVAVWLIQRAGEST